MKKKYIISPEEFEAIKEAITSVLRLDINTSLCAASEEDTELSMSKETFFTNLASEFIIE